MKIIIKKFNELTINELYELLALREEIFIVEQDCPYNDLDYKDQNSVHLWIEEDNKIVSYIRLLPNGVSYKTSPSIGRVTTHKDYRKRGLSRRVMEEGIKYIFDTFGNNTIEISAQSYLLGFYGSLGFEVEGEEYLEDGLPHRHMILKKSLS